MTDYTSSALAKIEAGQKDIKGHHARAVAPAVTEALREFCRQDGEFAQAVAQGGTLADCLAAVVRGVGGSISDLDCYRRAARYYFPGAEIEMTMRIRTNPAEDWESAEGPAGGILLSFSDFF